MNVIAKVLRTEGRPALGSVCTILHLEGGERGCYLYRVQYHTSTSRRQKSTRHNEESIAERLSDWGQYWILWDRFTNAFGTFVASCFRRVYCVFEMPLCTSQGETSVTSRKGGVQQIVPKIFMYNIGVKPS